MGDADLTDQILSTTGEMHSLQDGGTVGVLLGLVLTGSPLLPVVAAALGLGASRLSVHGLARRVDDLVRVDDVRTNPEYAVVGILVSTPVTACVSLLTERLVAVV